MRVKCQSKKTGNTVYLVDIEDCNRRHEPRAVADEEARPGHSGGRFTLPLGRFWATYEKV